MTPSVKTLIWNALLYHGRISDGKPSRWGQTYQDSPHKMRDLIDHVKRYGWNPETYRHPQEGTSYEWGGTEADDIKVEFIEGTVVFPDGGTFFLIWVPSSPRVFDVLRDLESCRT